MTTKRVLIGISVAVAAGVTAFAVWPRSAINVENAAKIEPGMDLGKVEALLGGPARDESNGPLVAEFRDVEDADWFGRELLRHRAITPFWSRSGNPMTPSSLSRWTMIGVSYVGS